VAEKLEAMLDFFTLHLPPSYRVWRGVFYFKMGGDGRLYFLWSLSPSPSPARSLDPPLTRLALSWAATGVPPLSLPYFPPSLSLAP
jgi:hypothetical protein